MKAKKPGFQFDETMAGVWHGPGSQGDQPIRFSIRSRASSLKDFLKTGHMNAEGWIDARELTSGRQPCRGTLVMPVRSREVHIDLGFVGMDGKSYRYVAEKRLSLLNFVRDITTFSGGILDASGALVGETVTRFDLKGDFLKLLLSIRV